jgi:hypothetical protein
MTAATALALDFATQEALQRHAGYHIGRYLPNRSHLTAVPSSSSAGTTWPLSHSQDAMEAMSFKTTSKERFFSRDEHLRRIADALGRRMYPNTPLHPKVLGNAIGVTARTILNWRNGRCDLGTYEFGRLCDYFERIEGSPLFRVEIYGDEIGIAMARRAAAAHRLIEAAAELKAMEG